MKLILYLPYLFLLYTVFGNDHCKLEGQKSAKTVRVLLENGEVEGLLSTSRDGKEYESYQGVPYGKVVRRFANPISADKWNGVLDGKQRAPACYNAGEFAGFDGAEDCLKLDVYTPVQKDPKIKLPVMVWIYGGGFVAGATLLYGPDYLMDTGDIVLVMINYRLGAFGFLNTGTKSARGNMGMKDQVLGLQWVRDNIHHFSGNKDLVTIFGESAGSMSVSLHVTSPMSSGLFHRAIMQSGTFTTPFMHRMLDGPSLAKRLAAALDCPTADGEGLVRCLERIDPKELGKQVQMVDEFGFNPESLGMGPSLETYYEEGNDTNIFMKEDPLLLAEEGRINKVPLVLGVTAYENIMEPGTVFKKDAAVKKLNHQWGRHGLSMLHLKDDAEDPTQALFKIRKHFVSGRDGEEYPEITKEKGQEIDYLISDRHWTHPLRLAAAAMAKHTPVYVYNLTLNPVIVRDESNAFPQDYPEDQKRRVPSHADDLPFLFKMGGIFEYAFGIIDKNHEDYKLSKDFVKAWTSFAKTGNFSSSPWSSWGPVEGRKSFFNSSYLEIDNSTILTKMPDFWKRDHEFWENLRLKYWGGKWDSEN